MPLKLIDLSNMEFEAIDGLIPIATADYMNPSGVKPMDTAFETETAFVGFLYMAAQYLEVINVVAAWVDLTPISLDPTSQTE